MIFDFSTREIISEIPHKETLKLIESLLTKEEFEEIQSSILLKIKNRLCFSFFNPNIKSNGYKILLDKVSNKNLNFAKFLYQYVGLIVIQKEQDLWGIENHRKGEKIFYKIKNVKKD